MYIWSMVGADVDNGNWAMLGTRAAVYKTMCTDWDYIQVRDFKYLNTLCGKCLSNQLKTLTTK